MSNTQIKNHNWNVVWKEGKYYVSQSLNVDVSSFGNTKQEALDNLEEALELYFEDEQQHKKVVSVEEPEVFMSHFHYA
jgi:predicted RNase H-like HicB family nuclease